MGVAARRKLVEIGTTAGSTARDNMSSYFTDFGVTLTRGTEFDTAFDPEGKRRFEQTRTALLTDGSFSGGGRWQPTVHRAITKARRSLLDNDSGEGLSFRYGPQGGKSSNRVQTGTAILTGFSITFGKTAINEFTIQGQISGEVTESTLSSDVSDTPDFEHGVAGFRTGILIGQYNASRYFDTFSINGSLATVQDGGFQPPGNIQEYLVTLGDHEFSASGPWTGDRHNRLIGYLGAESGQITTLVPGGFEVGNVAILFQSLQTQFETSGRYDDKLMYSLGMQAADNTAINGTLIAHGVQKSGTTALTSVGTLGAGITASATSITLAATATETVSVGTVLRVGDEDMLVTAVSSQTAFTVERGYGANAAAAAASGAAVNSLDNPARVRGIPTEAVDVGFDPGKNGIFNIHTTAHSSDLTIEIQSASSKNGSFTQVGSDITVTGAGAQVAEAGDTAPSKWMRVKVSGGNGTVSVAYGE